MLFKGRKTGLKAGDRAIFNPKTGIMTIERKNIPLIRSTTGSPEYHLGDKADTTWANALCGFFAEMYGLKVSLPQPDRGLVFFTFEK